MENMAARLESLEAQIRRWRLAALLVLVGMATMLLSGAGPLHDTPARRLAAENFVLVDDMKIHLRGSQFEKVLPCWSFMTQMES
jgi:hypothetical protein